MRLGHEVSSRWPLIGRYLHVKAGMVDGDFADWSYWTSEKLSPAERAAAYEQWADFWGWCLEHRGGEWANDPGLRLLVERWTDSMAYCCRRSAVWARGEDPGEWIPQWQRRPDLDAALRARVAEIIADAQPAGAGSVRHLRKAG